MAFSFTRIIRFSDTDSAGVVYFSNVLSICHEAYEESLRAFGVDVKSFFIHPETAYPIVRASIDFQRPMYCGDEICISVSPKITDEYSFEISYVIQSSSAEIILGKGSTKHVCIDAKARKKQPLDSTIVRWVDSCNL